MTSTNSPLSRPPREDEDFERVHIQLWASDTEMIRHLYGSTVGLSKFVRTVVRDYLDKVRARAEEKASRQLGDQE